MFNDKMLFLFTDNIVLQLSLIFSKHFVIILLRQTHHTTWKRYRLILLSLLTLVDGVNPESTAPFYILSQMKTP